jgi:hypothetical protein
VERLKCLLLEIVRALFGRAMFCVINRTTDLVKYAAA